MSDEVITRVDADGNATAMRNRPDAHNAFDPAMTRRRTASRKKLDETSRRVAAIRATAEGQEGLSAFLEKRNPDWVEPAPSAIRKTKKS